MDKDEKMDLDQFENNSGFSEPEQDPAAEFLAREQNAFAGLESENFQPELQNFDNAPMEPTGSFEMINTVGENHDISNGQVKEEPEKIIKWREEQKKILEKKDKEEEVKKQELLQHAKNELEEWYKQHEESISRTKAANRESAKNAEKQCVAEKDEIEPGMEWERIAKLCDFNPKTNKSSKDVSRMRSLILQLKQNQQTPLKKVS